MLILFSMGSSRFDLKKCGVRFEPPAVIVYYLDTDSGKLHKRIMPVRSLKKNARVQRIAEEMKERHSHILEHMPLVRLEKFLRIIQERMKGRPMEDCIRDVNKEFSIDEEENLNKLDDEALKRKKDLMNETFKVSNKTPSDPDFQYDIEVNFDQAAIEVSEWDSDEANLEF